MARRLTKKEKAEIRRLRKEGLTYQAIVDIVGWSRSSVCYTVNLTAAAKNSARQREYYKLNYSPARYGIKLCNQGICCSIRLKRLPYIHRPMKFEIVKSRKESDED